jgi:hypothetical protein
MACFQPLGFQAVGANLLRAVVTHCALIHTRTTNSSTFRDLPRRHRGLTRIARDTLGVERRSRFLDHSADGLGTRRTAGAIIIFMLDTPLDLPAEKFRTLHSAVEALKTCKTWLVLSWEAHMLVALRGQIPTLTSACTIANDHRSPSMKCASPRRRFALRGPYRS